MTRGTPCEGSTSAKFLASPRSDIDAGPEPVAYEFDGGGTGSRHDRRAWCRRARSVGACGEFDIGVQYFGTYLGNSGTCQVVSGGNIGAPSLRPSSWGVEVTAPGALLKRISP